MRQLFYLCCALLWVGCIGKQSQRTAEWVPAQPMPSRHLDAAHPVTKVAFGSCFDPHLPGAEIWESLRQQKPDVFLFTGDNVYQEVENGRPELLELRQAYAKLAHTQSFTRFRKDIPLLLTWDDHDFGLNDAGANWQHKDRAQRLFNYVWAIPAQGQSQQHPGVYNSHILGPEGQRVQIILLDTRYFRSDWKATDERNALGKERYVPDDDPKKTMLGEQQWQWLDAQLRKPAEIRLLVSSIQIIAEGHGFEAWRMLPKERARLYSLIADTRAQNVVFLSGDRHFAGYYREQAAGLPYPITELTSSPLNIPVGEEGQKFIQNEAGPKRLGSLISANNFGQVEIDWGAHKLYLDICDAQGTRLRREELTWSELK